MSDKNNNISKGCTKMNTPFSAIEARNADGQTIGTHVYTGATEEERCTETAVFMNKHRGFNNATTFKHHGETVWIYDAKEMRIVYKASGFVKECEQDLRRMDQEGEYDRGYHDGDQGTYQP